MGYTATRVAENFTSYSVSVTGLYVYTVSTDGGGTATTGGTAERLYYNSASAGTVAIWWATAGQSITVGRQYYGQLIRIDGIPKKPEIELLNSQSNGTNGVAITADGYKDNIYLGVVTEYSHENPGGLSYSFSCPNATITTIGHSNPGWSKNAMSLIVPTQDATISVNASSGSYNEPKYKYIFQIIIKYTISATIDPQDSGYVSNVGTYSMGSLVNVEAVGNGYYLDKWLLRGFTRLDYIGCSGTQWINTNFIASDNTNLKIICDFLTTNDNGNDRYVFGAGFNGNTLNLTYNNRIYSGSNNYYLPIGTISANIKNHIEVENNSGSLSVLLNGNNYTGTTDTDYSTYPITIFGIANGASSVYTGLNAQSTNVYYFKLYNNDVLVRNFIPVIRHSDGVIGMYDLVNFKFYGNNGTGTFIGGDIYAS